VYHPDQPATIFYPPKNRARGKADEETKKSSEAAAVKRKRTNITPEPTYDKPPSTLCLVIQVLQRKNLPMATDFSAFYQTLKDEGISTEYWCLETWNRLSRSMATVFTVEMIWMKGGVALCSPKGMTNFTMLSRMSRV
jgi:hypothetical protein